MVKKTVILDLCGGTGAWSAPWKAAGYGVSVVTLPEYDVTKAVIGHQFTTFPRKSGGSLVVRNESVLGILAAPPCTEFSRAKQFHGKGHYQHDFAKGLEPVVACLRLIGEIQPTWWAMENPNGFLKRWMGEAHESFEPWEYGDNYQKTTLLWGKFNMPERKVVNKPAGLKKFSLLKSKEIAPEYFGIYDRTVRRSITPTGFAKAFFEANKE